MPKYASLTDEDIAYVQKYLHYDPVTGVFTWKIVRRAMPAGSVAGTVCKRGYRYISIRGRIRKASRLAWFISYGKLPAEELDHINGKRDDNRLANLREASHAQNMQNTGVRQGKPNKTGFRCVFETKSGRYECSVSAGSRRRHLGTFDTPEEAYSVYLAAAEKLHKDFYWKANWE